MSVARHPEKAKLAPQPRLPKPPWLKITAPSAARSEGFRASARAVRRHGLHTICQEGACPNLSACWQQRHASFMILGAICTRACAFCNVATGKPKGVDASEPQRLAAAAAEMQLSHVVVTSVDRDDLEDGGAAHFAACARALRARLPNASLEFLLPDFRRKTTALDIVLAAPPDVFNHNLETVPRLYRTIRPGADYEHSLRLLATAKQRAPALFTKSGLMLGLGEEPDEVDAVLQDLRGADVDFVTLGQYLPPTPRHARLARYIPPSEFADWAARARALGFAMVAASPLTRSSFHADKDFAALRQARSRT